MSSLPNVERRRPLLDRQVASIETAASAAGAFAASVLRRDGCCDEVVVLQGGEMVGSVFRPEHGGLAIWRRVGKQRRVSDPMEAVQVILKGRVTSASRPRG